MPDWVSFDDICKTEYALISKLLLRRCTGIITYIVRNPWNCSIGEKISHMSTNNDICIFAGKYCCWRIKKAEKWSQVLSPAFHPILLPPSFLPLSDQIAFCFFPVVAWCNPHCCLNIKWRKGEIMEQQGRRRRRRSRRGWGTVLPWRPSSKEIVLPHVKEKSIIKTFPPPSSPSNTFNLPYIKALIYITKANTWKESSKCLCDGCDVMYYVAQKAVLGPYCWLMLLLKCVSLLSLLSWLVLVLCLYEDGNKATMISGCCVGHCLGFIFFTVVLVLTAMGNTRTHAPTHSYTAQVEPCKWPNCCVIDDFIGQTVKNTALQQRPIRAKIMIGYCVACRHSNVNAVKAVCCRGAESRFAGIGVTGRWAHRRSPEAKQSNVRSYQPALIANLLQVLVRQQLQKQQQMRLSAPLQAQQKNKTKHQNTKNPPQNKILTNNDS